MNCTNCNAEITNQFDHAVKTISVCNMGKSTRTEYHCDGNKPNHDICISLLLGKINEIAMFKRDDVNALSKYYMYVRGEL